MHNFDNLFFHCNCSEHSPTVGNASSPVAIVHASQGSSSSEESEAALAGISEEPTTPPAQETVNPSQKVVKEKCCNNFIYLVSSFSWELNISPHWSLASLTLTANKSVKHDFPVREVLVCNSFIIDSSFQYSTLFLKSIVQNSNQHNF